MRCLSMVGFSEHAEEIYFLRVWAVELPEGLRAEELTEEIDAKQRELDAEQKVLDAKQEQLRILQRILADVAQISKRRSRSRSRSRDTERVVRRAAPPASSG